MVAGDATRRVTIQMLPDKKHQTAGSAPTQLDQINRRGPVCVNIAISGLASVIEHIHPAVIAMKNDGAAIKLVE